MSQFFAVDICCKRCNLLHGCDALSVENGMVVLRCQGCGAKEPLPDTHPRWGAVEAHDAD